MTKELKEFLDNAIDTYAIPVYLIEELQEQFKNGKTVLQLVDMINKDIKELKEFKYAMLDTVEDYLLEGGE